MDILTLDFETFYSTEYSLRRMSPAEYILDPQFECTGLAVKKNREPAFWIDGDKVEDFFASQDKNVMAVSHNSLFDMCIASWRYGWVPKVMVDTIGVSRSMLQAYLRSLSLDSVAEYLGLGKKTGALANVKAMRLAEIKAHPDLYRKFVEYGINDAELCFGIFDKLVLGNGYHTRFPATEIAIMDSVLRCAVEPLFRVDQNVLRTSLAAIKQEKEQILAQAMLLGVDGKSSLMSNDKFADVLRSLGVVPPTKISGTTGKETYAFAKSDQDFIDLLEHPDPKVQTVVSARMGHKSTIEETRHERFINIANLEWPTTGSYHGGYLSLMPMPLRFGGAHTHRLSGDWKLNVQNMGRGSMLRHSLVAPEGHVVVAGDESQVEARFVCTLAGQEDMRKQFENGEDVYSIFATGLFNQVITKANKIERFIGKQCILGLGYGLGKDKHTATVPVLAWNQMGIELPYTLEQGAAAVNFYRTKNHHIANTWKLLNTQGIHALHTGQEWQWGPVLFKKEEIVLPNGMSLYYHNLRQVPGGRFGHEWVFDYGGKTKRIYGGKLLENIVQALARIVTMEAAMRIRQKLARINVRMALQVHDELVFVVKEEYADIVRKVLEIELRRRPDWLPTLPLDCETGVGPSYGDAK